MRTCSLDHKLDSPRPATLGRAMARPRSPLRYEPESASLNPRRPGLRSSGQAGRISDESEEDERVDVGFEALARPLHNESHEDYADLHRRVILERERQQKEAERQRWEAERLRREAEKKRFEGVIPESRIPEKTQELPLLLLCGVLLLVVGVGLAAYFHYSAPPDPKVYDDWLSKNLTANIHTMRAQFPSQGNNTWLNFYAGIRRVLLDDPTEPSVFLLVYRGDGEDTCACLARKAARIAQGVLEAPVNEPLTVDGATLDSYADGRLIDAYGPLVERHRTLVLERLHLVPAGVARGLHIFCDTVTPLVRKAVYIFTLDVGSGGGSPSEAAQRGLYAAWGRLEPDILAPLVARVMGGFVFAVEPEGDEASAC